MKRRFRATIQTRVLILALSGLVLCAFAFGKLCLHTTDKVVHESTEKHLHNLTSIETIKINNRLKNVEQYVNTLNIAVMGMLDSLEQLTDSTHLEEFTEKSRELIRLTIGNTDKAVAAYLRFNPKFTPPTSGIFMAKTSRDHELKFLEPTDFSKYNPCSEEVQHHYPGTPLRSHILFPIWHSLIQTHTYPVHMLFS